MPSAIRTPGLSTAFLALALASASRAQAVDTASSPIMEPAKHATPSEPSRTSPARQRAHLISPTLSAALADTLPKYDPLAKTAPSESDQPKNGIIRLQKFIVKQPKPPALTERDVLTQQGKIEYMMKRHPGLKLAGGGIALEMYQEEVRLENLADLADSAKSTRNFGDSAGADAIARERTRLAYRPSGIGGGR